MRKLSALFFLILAVTISRGPLVKGGADPVWDNSIEQSSIFDGANYRMITKYGDYVWLQPNNIMEYWNLDGEKVIDKSIWILQHNTSGVWLPLLDFENQRITLVNDTFYEIAYEVKYKKQGPSLIVGSVEISFYSSGSSMNKPKIQVNFTKGTGWDDLSMGSFRWIWDIVPKDNLRKIFKGGKIIDLDQTDFMDHALKIYFGEEGKSINYLIDTSEFLAIKTRVQSEWRRGFSTTQNITYRDYIGIDIFGGDGSYFNTKGFILMYPPNEGIIDPSIITTKDVSDSTRYESQVHLFRNPWGQQWYYFVDNNITHFIFYKSETGEDWEISYEWGDFEPRNDFDFVYWYNSTGEYTLVQIFTVIEIDSAPFGYILLMKINDTSTDIETHLRYQQYFFEVYEDGISNLNSELDIFGRVWYSWTEEFTIAGKQRCTPYIFYQKRPGQETSYLTGDSYSKAEIIFRGSVETKAPDFFSRTELVPLNRTFEDGYDMLMAVIFDGDSFTTGNYFLNVTEFGYNSSMIPFFDYPYSGDDMTVLDYHTGVEQIEGNLNQAQNPPVFSSYSNENKSDVYVLHTPSAGDQLQIDIAHPTLNTTSDNWVDIYTGSGISETYQMTFNHTALPEEIFIFWLNSSGTEDNIIYVSVLNITEPVSEIIGFWEETVGTDLSYLQSINHEDFNLDIYVWATNGTTNTRFYILPFPPEIVYPGDPDLLFGAGFNGSILGYVLIHWDHPLVDYTDFEIYNSTDGITFSFLDTVSVTWYNHSSLENMTYQYYKVRARNYIDYYDQYFNSSWSDVDLERVFFSVGALPPSNGDIIIQETDYPWVAIAIILMCVAYLLAIRYD